MSLFEILELVAFLTLVSVTDIYFFIYLLFHYFLQRSTLVFLDLLGLVNL